MRVISTPDAPPPAGHYSQAIVYGDTVYVSGELAVNHSTGEEGIGSIEDIDTAMQLGTGYPMGPFVLGDFVGLDTLYYIAEIMFDEYREKRFAPPPLLKRMYLAGYHGRKAGKGFYDYSGDEPVVSDFVRT